MAKAKDKEQQQPGNGAETTAPEEAAAEAAPAAEAAMAAGNEAQDQAHDQAHESVSAAAYADLLQENERLQLERQEHIDQALRATAELDNVRKRAVRDVENAHKYALERFVNELLPVLDSMELGLNASQSAQDIESLREGLDLTLKKLFDCLDKFGVKTIDPAGEKFDPDWHEAVSMQELAGAAAGDIVTVMQKGYELNGRLVRPAMVVVAKS